jgi:hypothetical protein
VAGAAAAGVRDVPTRSVSRPGTSTCGSRCGGRQSCCCRTYWQADRPLTELIDADYTFLNERLARFYEIPGVTGPAFQPRPAEGSCRSRGGILTQASVLTVSSYATRTSPVLRGKWILENILNAPPPAPPAGFRR